MTRAMHAGWFIIATLLAPAISAQEPTDDRPKCHLVRGGLTHEKISDLCGILETGQIPVGCEVWRDWYESTFARLRRNLPDSATERDVADLRRYVVAGMWYFYRPLCAAERIEAICLGTDDPLLLLLLIPYIIAAELRSTLPKLQAWRTRLQEDGADKYLKVHLHLTNQIKSAKTAWLTFGTACSALGDQSRGREILDGLRELMRGKRYSELPEPLPVIGVWRDPLVFEFLKEILTSPDEPGHLMARNMMDGLTNPEGPFTRRPKEWDIEDSLPKEEPPPPSVEYWLAWLQTNQGHLEWVDEPQSVRRGRIGWWRVQSDPSSKK